MALGTFQRSIVDSTGDVQPGAQVTVTLEGGGLATLYDNRDGSGPPIANPITADSGGFVRFFTEAGAYRIQAIKDSLQITWRYVPIGTAGEFNINAPAIAGGFVIFDETNTLAATPAIEVDQYFNLVINAGLKFANAGAFIDFENGQWRADYASGVLDITTGDLRISGSSVATFSDIATNWPGTAGQVLTSNGVSSPPSFQTAGASSASFDIDVTTTPYDSDHAFYFATYQCEAANIITLTQSEDQSGFDGGGFRDALAVFHYDDDAVNYEYLADQKVSYGVRSYVTPTTAGKLLTQPQYKDFVGGTFEAIGRIEWADRGTSGITASAIQYGKGIASNEFAASNPSDAVTQSLSMAALQAILSGKKAAADSSHKVRGVLITNVGKSASAGVELFSAGTDGDNGQYEYMLRGDNATVNVGAILMPASSAGNVGTYIVYDTGDRTEYDRAANAFTWVIGGSGELTLNAVALFPTSDSGLSLGVAGTNQWSALHLANTGSIQWNNGDVAITHSANLLTMDGGGFVFNEAGGDFDWRMEGDNEVNLFYSDAGNDRIGIGTASPSHRLTVTTASSNAYIASRDAAGVISLFGSNGSDRGLVGTFSNHMFSIYTNSNEVVRVTTNANVLIGTTTENSQRVQILASSQAFYVGVTARGWLASSDGSFAYWSAVNHAVNAYADAVLDGNSLSLRAVGNEKLNIAASAMVFNESGADYDIRMEGDTNANLFYLDASTDRIGIGTSTPASFLDVRGNVIAPNLQQMIRITGVNFNSANTDNAITVVLPNGYSRWRMGGLVISGASASLTTSTWGLFTSTGGGGTAIFSGQANTVSSASENTANNMQFVTHAAVNTTSYNATTVYFRVGTAQGSAATGNVTLFFQPVS